MKISIEIDSNEVGAAATSVLLGHVAAALGKQPAEKVKDMEVVAEEIPNSPGPTPEQIAATKKAEAAEKRKKAREEKKRLLAEQEAAETAEAAKGQEDAEDAEDAEDDLMGGDEEVPAKTLKDVRTALSKKVGAHRPAIKAELTRRGVENVATLPKEELGSMFAFLEAL